MAQHAAVITGVAPDAVTTGRDLDHAASVAASAPLFTVAYYGEGVFVGRSQPIPYESAAAWAKWGNENYPELRHYAEECIADARASEAGAGKEQG